MRGSYIRDLKVSTEGAVIGSGGRLFHWLMVRGRTTPSCKRSCKQVLLLFIFCVPQWTRLSKSTMDSVIQVPYAEDPDFFS